MAVSGAAMETVRVGRITPGSYLASLWRYRHLMFHLANSDLQSRFRGSSLGVLWAMIHPLSFALLYSVVLATLFQQEFKAFSVYVFAGFILWEAISAFVTLGSQSIINGGGYLKQAPIPMLIFPVRTCMTVTVVFLIGFVAFFLYRTAIILVFGLNEPIMTIHWAWTAPLIIALFLLGSAMATIVAFINLKFRDTQQLLMIVMQAIWFSSPVFFAREVFDNPRLELWSAINPVLAFCDVFRDAVINARTPEVRDWITIGAWTAGAWAIAIVITALNDRKSIYYV